MCYSLLLPQTNCCSQSLTFSANRCSVVVTKFQLLGSLCEFVYYQWSVVNFTTESQFVWVIVYCQWSVLTAEFQLLGSLFEFAYCQWSVVITKFQLLGSFCVCVLSAVCCDYQVPVAWIILCLCIVSGLL